MKTMNATQARTRFGALLMAAATEPVFVRKNGREVAVVVSPEEYDRMRMAKAIQNVTGTGKVRPQVEKLLRESIEKRRSLYEALSKLD
jgi:prevent-host-death family protein